MALDVAVVGNLLRLWNMMQGALETEVQIQVYVLTWLRPFYVCQVQFGLSSIGSGY